MSRRLREATSGRGVLIDVRTLEMMIDYAILEGAELRLPLFVLLLRAARLELMTGVATESGPPDRRGESRRKNGLAPDDDAACVLAARDVLDSCRQLIRER
jgi:hypothetical protein